MMKCPKCSKDSGDSWVQCEGQCPMYMSPHYDIQIDPFVPGAYVIATRWSDEDPEDPWVVGFIDEVRTYGDRRFYTVNGGEGFPAGREWPCVRLLTEEEGRAIVENGGPTRIIDPVPGDTLIEQLEALAHDPDGYDYDETSKVLRAAIKELQLR